MFACRRDDSKTALFRPRYAMHGRAVRLTCVTKSMAVIEQCGDKLLVYVRRSSPDTTLVLHILDCCSPSAFKRQ